MNPAAVHDRTIARSSESGRRAHLLRLALAYRTATRNCRRIMLTRARLRDAGERAPAGMIATLIAERVHRDHAIQQIEARGEQHLADLLRAEHEYLLAGLAVTMRTRPYRDAGAVRFRRAIAALFRDPVECLGCAARVYDVADGVWLAYDGDTARCPATSGVTPHRAPRTAPRGLFPHPQPGPRQGEGKCVRCCDRLTPDEYGADRSVSTELYVCWPDGPLHART